MPFGSSPIRPDGWDPTGLKYRKVTTDHGSAVESNGRRGEERRGERRREWRRVKGREKQRREEG